MIGLGAALYFWLPFEPPLVVGVAVFIVTLVWTAMRWRVGIQNLTAISLCLIAAGMLAAIARTAHVSAPKLSAELKYAEVTGTVVEIEEYSTRHHRVTLQDLVILDLPEAETPARVRVVVRTDMGGAGPGDRVVLAAGLLPPAGPSAPGAYDFARRAWFDQLGAVGYALSPIKVVDSPTTMSFWDRIPLHINALRGEIARRILEAGAGDSNAAIAAALITGHRKAIAAADTAALRNTGLAHLLAISGLHIGLLTGIAFFTIRALLALLEPVALRLNIKKIAVLLALIPATAYLVLSGGTIPTQRAYIMTLFVMIALLLDRQAISMRLVAVAALAILILRPESILSISFQMSFSAVVALVAYYEYLRNQSFLWLRMQRGWWRRFIFYLVAIAMTTVVSEVATGPLALYHFNQTPLYGLVANMTAVPLMAFWVMPWILVTLLALPFGLENLTIAPLMWGIEGIVVTAHWVETWPHATMRIAALPNLFLATFAIGGLWLCIWKQKWRWFGLVGMAAAGVIAAQVNTPDILIDSDARLVGLKSPSGELVVSNSRRARIVRETWARRQGQDKIKAWSVPVKPTSVAGVSPWLSCDTLGCLYQLPGSKYKTAIVMDPQALSEDCTRADLVISLVPVFVRCPAPLGVIDRFDISRDGAYAVFWGKSGPIIRTSAEIRGNRPWSVAR